VWARERDSGRLIFLAPGDADRFRAACDAGELLCPIPGCEAPAFRARGAEIRRHHFAHREAKASHQPHEVWRVEALAALGGWLAERWPDLPVTPVGDDALELASPRTGRRVVLAVSARRVTLDGWHARRREAHARGVAWQLLLAPTPGVLRVVDELADGIYATRLWGAVADIVLQTGAAVALNPQARLVGTITSTHLAHAATLARGDGRGDGRLIVEALAACQLTLDGVVPPAAAAARAAAQPPAPPARPRLPHPATPTPTPVTPAAAPTRPAERLPEVAPGTAATEGMDQLTRWAIFQQAMRRKPRP